MRNKSRHDLYDFKETNDIDLEKIAIKIPAAEYGLEYRRTLNEKESESVLFYGGNTVGSKLLVRISRTSDGLSSIWITLKLESGEEYFLPTEQFHVEPKTGQESFVGGGLRVKCLLPMRRWRISFNGFMRKHGSESGKAVHVRFGFLWIASSSPRNVTTDIHVKTWAHFLSKETDWTAKIKEMSSMLDRYVQMGNMLGVVDIPEDEIENRELYLWGARSRNQENQCNKKGLTTMESICYFKSGESLYFGQIQLPSAKNKLEFAFVVFGNSLGGPCRSAEITVDSEGNQIVTYTRGPATRHCIINKPSNKQSLHKGGSDFTAVEVSFFEAVLEGDDNGHGITLLEKGKVAHKLTKPEIKLPPLEPPSCKKLVLPLSDKECRLSEISGGKGSSLAELTILSQHDQVQKKFQVPKGVVVSTNAYQQFATDIHMIDIITSIEKSARENPALLQESCKLVEAEIQKRVLSQRIKDQIYQTMEQCFGPNFKSLRFAVRSSASGEDSEELSAAGQMKTYLGVQGMDKIYEAVVNCWSSQFSFIAVQYKRQNGQILNSPMAVVIQEMVPADVAGVMFTCDPVTGNPANITITANYGIGESVVSASAEPDTIIVGRNEKGLDGSSNIDIGKKSTHIILSVQGGVKEETLPEILSNKSSLSIEDAKYLADVGILVEQCYGIPVDVEWGFFQNELFLLQARPITTFDRESDFELSHELDTPLRSEIECNTTANIGEVMAGAFSHLGLFTANTMFQTVCQWHLNRRGKYNYPMSPYYLKSITNVQNHGLLNVMDSLLRFYHGEDNLVTDAQMISLLGRLFDDDDDDDIKKQAAKRNVFYPPNSAIVQTYYILGDLLLSNKRLKKEKERFWDSEIKPKGNLNSADFYDEIWKQFLLAADTMRNHLECTMASSIYNMFLLSILRNSNKGWGPTVFQDFGYVLSSCYEVESADVPKALDKLANEISSCTNASSFKEMKTEDALNWLSTTGFEAGESFKKFLKMHGHRCYKEFDVYNTTWDSDPLSMVKILQSMVNTEGKKENEKTFIGLRETVRNLAVPLKDWKTKIIAGIAIHLCRKAVGWRERSKSLLVKVMDKMRIAYRQMGQLMVKEGRLPDSDLIFFLTGPELNQLIKTRSAALVQKAIRRKAQHSELDKIKFPEINIGCPVAINFSKIVTHEGSLLIKGTPVSTGVAEGKARVATSLEEAAHLENGEILIAYGTDIGWSPYFPMLAGVATELGGLVSHGAVVAREYGLPCVVGVKGATVLFKTGDRVLLNGNKGTLQRIDE